MKAYITYDAQGSAGYVAKVITEQDYDERGPHAYSHKTVVCENWLTAIGHAHDWALRAGLKVVSLEDF